MSDIASWIASAATMIAAMMTAANLGARVTGWGFVVFTVGSIAWATVGILTGQTSLAITNGFLLLVNIFGVWRWLGRQARYEQGSTAATERSRRRRHVQTLFSGSSLIGAKVESGDGQGAGTIVDAMFGCDDNRLSYVVLSQGGVGGAGETLRAVSGDQFDLSGETLVCRLTLAEIDSLQPIETEVWPVAAPSPPRAALTSPIGQSHAPSVQA